MKIVKFNYNGNKVAFDNSNGVMVNATEMAKPFGKRVSDWLSNQYTKEFIAELTVTRKSATADYQAVIIRQGANNHQGGRLNNVRVYNQGDGQRAGIFHRKNC